MHRNLLKITDLAILKADVDKLAIDKPKTILNDLNSLKSKVNIIDIDKMKTVPVDF